MKTMKFLTYSIFVLFLAFIITACSGDDGATGPVGADGVDGQDGNANVIYSDWIEYQMANWEAYVVEYSVGTRKYPITVSNLTEEIVNHGVVLMYTKFLGTGNEIFTLPLTFNITGMGSGIQILSYTLQISKIVIRMINSDGAGDPGTFGAGNTYRYILIEGSTLGGKSASGKQEIYNELKNAGVDINDYNEVCDYYGIDPE